MHYITDIFMTETRNITNKETEKIDNYSKLQIKHAIPKIEWAIELFYNSV